MTLVAVWVRQNETLRELVAVADSRLSGGESWDKCPKLMPLPRPATAIAMSGEATAAYAFLIQATNLCLLLDGNRSGRTDIGYLARKLADVYADSRAGVSDLHSGATEPDVPELDVVLMGWSWRRLRFEAYSYRYDGSGVLRMHPLPELYPERAYGIYFAGDASSEARARLHRLKEVRGLPVPIAGHPEAEDMARDANLDWEPLEVLMDLIGDVTVRTVGGVPQLLRIYQYGETESFVWRTAEGVDHFGGRPINDGERFDRRIATYADGYLKISMSDQSVGPDAPPSSGTDPRRPTGRLGPGVTPDAPTAR
ncbi:hypothetical protein C1S82_31515 [Mycolicibacterium cosmeticum]|uniref:Uncharacterized protein n=1 Tax=Mycolicibacterium cosmeticum TaxID=258533 RepID=W9AW18_MYCCO|nr:hypothetical protein [Mycolicibacterium cosmeticum]TLH64559.1 hypothetical protein C1S82_31515 [Mycolicibacterium cosmeticum]CDO06791.1 hypothetical protein BN977_01584 [Mycolicibacterium cosmeticum]